VDTELHVRVVQVPGAILAILTKVSCLLLQTLQADTVMLL
jgi:hypothetical protein